MQLMRVKARFQARGEAEPPVSDSSYALICGFRLQSRTSVSSEVNLTVCVFKVLSGPSSRLSALIKSSLSHASVGVKHFFFLITSFAEKNLAVPPSKQPHILLHPNFHPRWSPVSKRASRDGSLSSVVIVRRRTHQSHICFPF